MIVLSLMVCCVLTVACDAKPGAEEEACAPFDRKKDSLSVILSAVGSRSKDRPRVLMEKTDIGRGGGRAADVFEFLKRTMPSLRMATVEDYLAQNKTPLRFSSEDMGPESNLILAGEKEWREAEQKSKSPTWSDLELRGIKVGGYSEVSAVGFDSTHCQALIHVSSRSGPMLGYGLYLLFKKVDGMWVRVGEQRGWVA